MPIALAAALATASMSMPACSWNQPGANPFVGDVVAAVDRYGDIPADVRARLKARMADRRYDEIVTIGRDSIEGRATYSPEIRGMHFGRGRTCETVSRAQWSDTQRERGLVYCEDEHCILVPTVCRNVSRVSRERAAPAVMAARGFAPAADPVPAGGAAQPASALDPVADSGEESFSQAASADPRSGPVTALPAAGTPAAVAASPALDATGGPDTGNASGGGDWPAIPWAPAGGVALIGNTDNLVSGNTDNSGSDTGSGDSGTGTTGGGNPDLGGGGSTVVDNGTGTGSDTVVTPVPEPGTWAMMFAGVGLLGWLSRRRRG